MKHISLFFIICCFILPAFCQEEVRQEGIYTYVYGDDISKKHAKSIALEKAREDAIQKAFGSIISKEGSLDMSDVNGSSSIKFYQLGSSELMGRWLRDIEGPDYTDVSTEETNAITCRVKCLVQSVDRASVQFEWHLLRNFEDLRSETCEFQEEDNLFMTFQAPCDGYLAVFILDERGKAQCLIPHPEQPEGIYQIRRGREYLFFKNKHDNGDFMRRPYPMKLFVANDVEEYNQIYVFFSPNKFVVGNMKEAHNEEYIDSRGRIRKLPPEMSFKDFQKWQSANLRKDRDMQREKKIIRIRKNTEE